MSQHQRIAQLARRLTSHGETIARHLIARQSGDPLEVRRPESVGRSSGVSRPTERVSVEWETVQQRDARQLARLLVGHPDLFELHDVIGAMEIAEALHEPVEGSYLIAGEHRTITQLVGTVSEGDPSSREWCNCVAAVGLLWHITAEGIHDGWTRLYRSRWVIDSRGDTYLDQTAEEAALAWIGVVDRLERQLAALERRLTPAKLRICSCGCRRPLPDTERGPMRDACYQRRSRENKERAS